MRKKKLHRKNKIFILLACCLIFILAVVGIFSVYQHRLNQNFYAALTNGMEKNMENQKKYADATIHDLQRMLSALAATESAVSVDGWELMLQDDSVHIDYLNTEQLLDICGSEESSYAKELCKQLADGEEVLTDLGDSLFVDDPYSFALLYPICGEEDSMTGVLRARVNVNLLVSGNMNSDSLFQKMYTILTKSDGTVIYADTSYPDEQNLFSAVFHGGIDLDKVQYIQQSFEENAAQTIRFKGKGNDYYMSWASLDVNNWKIVSFARSPDVVLQTATILKGMALIGMLLIVLTVGFCLVFIQILRRQKRQLDVQQRRYDALAEFNNTLLFEYDAVANRMVFTPNAMERLDIDVKCLDGISQEYYMKHLLHPDDRNNVSKMFQSSIILNQICYLEARFKCRDGEYYWFGCQYKTIENSDEKASRIVGKLVDISNQRSREQLLRQAALVDVLTGVYNRSVENIINEKLERDARGLFFMIDMDNFKNVNDTFGHAAGDELLINVTHILRDVFRPDDIIGRIGGDEFVVFIFGTNDPRVAENRASAIQSYMERLYIPGSNQIVSASIGVAIAPQDGSTYEELASAADQAMYSIKKKSKKGFAFHLKNNT